MGETLEERILQFLEENDTPVAGLREGAMVWAEKVTHILKGSSGARIFRKAQAGRNQPWRELSSFVQIESSTQ